MRLSSSRAEIRRKNWLLRAEVHGKKSDVHTPVGRVRTRHTSCTLCEDEGLLAFIFDGLRSATCATRSSASSSLDEKRTSDKPYTKNGLSSLS